MAKKAKAKSKARKMKGRARKKVARRRVARKKPAIKRELKIIEAEIVKELRPVEKAAVKEERAIGKEVRIVEHELLHLERDMKRFGMLEVLQVLFGAIMLTSVFALQGQIWIVGITASWEFLIGLNVLFIAMAAAILYVAGYARIRRHHPILSRSVARRLLMLYMVCFTIAAAFLTAVRGGEWLVAPEIALKQIFTLVLPALAGGLTTDLIFAEM